MDLDRTVPIKSPKVGDGLSSLISFTTFSTVHGSLLSVVSLLLLPSSLSFCFSTFTPGLLPSFEICLLLVYLLRTGPRYVCLIYPLCLLCCLYPSDFVFLLLTPVSTTILITAMSGRCTLGKGHLYKSTGCGSLNKWRQVESEDSDTQSCKYIHP